MPFSRPLRALLIEDNFSDVELIHELLSEAVEDTKSAQISVEQEETLLGGMRRCAENDGTFDVILLDLGLPDSQGLETFTKLAERASRIPIIILTGIDDVDLALETVRRGAQDYLVKGRHDGEILLRAIRYAVERKQAEAKIARLNRLYTLLSKVNEAMWRIREPKKLYEETCRIVVEDGLFRMAWIGRADPGTHLIKPIAHWGFEDGYLDSVTISAEDIPEGRGPTGTAFREGRYNICDDFEHDPRFQIWRSEALKRGYRSSAGFPLKMGTRVIGVLTIYANEQLFFNDEEIQLIERLSDDIAFAIEFMEREEELIQRGEMLDLANDAIMIIDLDSTITYWNKGAERLYGWMRGEAMGQNVHEFLQAEYPESLDDALSVLYRDGAWDGELMHTTRDTTRIIVENHWTLYRDSDGKPSAILGVCNDITDRKHAEEALRRAHDELEQKVQERTRELQEEIDEHRVTEEELQRSNKELEQFAYIASHDLQEPLRTVTSSIGLLEKGYRDKLGEEADMFITYAVEGTKYMQQLIKDLLAYSRVTSRGEAFKPVHCEGVVQHAIDNLKIAIEESGVKIRLPEESLPMVMGDKTQLIQLFQNLIGNAIKFRSEQPPEVQIGVEPDGGNRWQFSIKDNGIGMDMQYADKIFTIFQRLHTTEEYDGTGVGLALCKKIVERHDGRIWVESKLGKGSTFYFTLPA
ncbi:MAG TPA: ATP-binding protein [Candidatus Acidoferrales bacterium]|nr:ATP-binding protein [Candidatus Acidoferrales bacterium]